MVSPSGQKMLRENPGQRIICMCCYRPKPSDKFMLAGEPGDVRREILSSGPNNWMTRN